MPTKPTGHAPILLWQLGALPKGASPKKGKSPKRLKGPMGPEAVAQENQELRAENTAQREEIAVRSAHGPLWG
jgi:hypothetical protein